MVEEVVQWLERQEMVRHRGQFSSLILTYS